MSDDDDSRDDESYDESEAPPPRQPAVGDDATLFAIATLGDQVTRGNADIHKRLNRSDEVATQRHMEYLDINHRQDGQIKASLARVDEIKKKVAGLEDRAGELERVVEGPVDEPGTVSHAVLVGLVDHKKEHDENFWTANLPSLLYQWRAYWKGILVCAVVVVGGAALSWDFALAWVMKKVGS